MKKKKIKKDMLLNCGWIEVGEQVVKRLFLYLIIRKPTQHPLSKSMQQIIQHRYAVTLAVKDIHEPDFSYGNYLIKKSDIFVYRQNKNVRK